MDRAGQLGRLRAWVSERDLALRLVLGDGEVLYGEWLWVRHGVAYDRLPDWLVALDLWRPSAGFASVVERDNRCKQAGLVIPPRLFAGSLGDRRALLHLLGPARFSSTDLSEGLVLRGKAGRRCKLVREGFERRDDEAWSHGLSYNEVDTARSAPTVARQAR